MDESNAWLGFWSDEFIQENIIDHLAARGIHVTLEQIKKELMRVEGEIEVDEILKKFSL